MKISFRKLKEEWQYIYDERLGIMAEDKQPTPLQEKTARDEADTHLEKVKQYLERIQT